MQAAEPIAKWKTAVSPGSYKSFSAKMLRVAEQSGINIIVDSSTRQEPSDVEDTNLAQILTAAVVEDKFSWRWANQNTLLLWPEQNIVSLAKIIVSQ